MAAAREDRGKGPILGFSFPRKCFGKACHVSTCCCSKNVIVEVINVSGKTLKGPSRQN